MMHVTLSSGLLKAAVLSPQVDSVSLKSRRMGTEAFLKLTFFIMLQKATQSSTQEDLL